MADKIDAQVRAASLECKANYQEAFLDGSDTGKGLKEVFRAFQEWNVSLENVVVNQFPTNLSQVETAFHLMQGRFIFKVGLRSASLVVWNPDWSELETIKRVARAGTDALRRGGEINFGEQEILLEIHVTPSGRSVAEITAPCVPPPLQGSARTDFRGSGFTLYTKRGFWHVDLSAMFPESLFLRLSIQFDPHTSLDEVGSQLLQEERRLLDSLALTVPGIT